MAVPLMRIRVLGSPQVWRGEQLLRFPTQKTLALLIYLAVEGGQHRREHLAALLWPEADAQRGPASVRTTLARLRAALSPGESPGERTIQVEGDIVAFAPETSHALDVAQLRAWAEAGAAVGDEIWPFLDQIHGDFLTGFSLPDAPEFDAWATRQREYWHTQLRQVLAAAAARRLNAGQLADGSALAERWVNHAPLDEAAHRMLMRLRFAAGDRAGALAAYETARRRLAAELTIEPADETQALAEHIRTAQPVTDAPPTNAPRGPAQLPFVGRAAEHARLAAAFADVQAGATRVAILAGEAGIGKTRLAHEFLRWAAAHRADTMQGRAFERSSPMPYQAIIAALRARIEQENAPEDLLEDVWLSELSRMLPELRARYPDLAPPPVDETFDRSHLFEAVALLALAMARRRTLVWLIDDLQWADESTLDLIHFVARRSAEQHAPALLLVTLRAEDLAATPPLRAWLSALMHDVASIRLDLRRLSAEAVHTLVRALIPASPRAFAEQLASATGGQPLFLQETLRALNDRGLLRPGARADTLEISVAQAIDFGAAPAGVRNLIVARVVRLSPPARDVLAAAAVCGPGFDFELARRVADADENATLAALDVLVASGLLTPAGGEPPTYRLHHDQTRDVLYTETGAARRRVFHRRALAVLASRRAPAAELAHHALHAGDADATFQYSLEAGNAALSLYALRDARKLYQQARTALRDRRERPAAWPELFDRLIRVHELAGARAAAQHVAEEMLAIAQEAEQPTAECAALNRLAVLATHAYEFERAGELLQRALLVAEAGGDTAGMARSEWSLAQLRHHLFDFRASRVHAARTVELAERLHDDALRAGALNALGYAELLTGELDAGETALHTALALYRDLGDRALQADCLTAQAAVEVWRGRASAGVRLATEARDISRAIDNPWGQVYSANWLALALADTGDLRAALEAARRGRAVAAANEFMPVSVFNLLVVGFVYRALRDLPRALEAHQAAQELDTRTAAEMAAAELCADYALLDDWERARQYAREAIKQRTYAALPFIVSPRWLEVRALARAGEVHAAAEDLQRWESLIANAPRFRVAQLRARAELAQPGDRRAAVQRLQEAQREAVRQQLPGEQWPILCDLARLHGELGQADLARETRAHARQIAGDLAVQNGDEALRDRWLT